jgi:hypothetical protein
MNRLPGETEVKPRAGVAKLSQAKKNEVKEMWMSRGSMVKHLNRHIVDVEA